VSFRTRVAAVAAVVVAIAIALACGAAYKGARDALIGSSDPSLALAYQSMHRYDPNPAQQGQPELDLDLASGFGWMVVSPDGTKLIYQNVSKVPVDSAIKALALSGGRPVFRTVSTKFGSFRELIAPIPYGFQFHAGGADLSYNSSSALVLVAPFQGTVGRLHSLGEGLLLIALLGIVVAALFGWLAARAALIPLADTTRDIEEVAMTLDVSHRVNEGTNDELGRLRRAFNQLLEELEISQDSQRQLILDASHELRTPLTSLRANAQVLGRIDELGEDDVTQLSDDMVTQVDELTRLVGDLTELTRGEHSAEEAQVLRLDELVGECVEIAETHARTKQITVDFTSERSDVQVKRNRLVRAVGNLLDNAIKFSPEGARILVTCSHGTVVVEDAGPGIDEGDRPFIFDRFYRSPRDRGRPGSGLGLAIVAQVVSEAGGQVNAGASASLGGAKLSISLPQVPQNSKFSTVS